MKDIFEENGRRVSWLLTELEHQTENRLSDDSRQELLSEVAAHLDSAIRARLELGMVPLDAEREAVELFGHPKVYVDELLAVHEGVQETKPHPWLWLKGDRRTLVTFWAAMLFATVFLVSQQSMMSVDLAAVIWIGFGIVLGYVSFRVRRIQLLPMALAALAGYVVLTLGITAFWTTFEYNGYPYAVPNWKVQKVLAEDESILEKVIQPLAKLQHGLSVLTLHHSAAATKEEVAESKALLKSEPIITFNEVDRYYAPTDLSPALLHILYVPAKNEVEAEHAWRVTGKRVVDEFKRSKDQCEMQITGIKDAQKQFAVVSFVKNLWSYRPAVLGFLGFGIVINLLGGGLGWLTARPWRRRRRRVAP